MSIIDFEYSVFKNGGEVVWLVSMFLHSFHVGQSMETCRVLRRDLQGRFPMLKSDRSYERYREFIRKQTMEGSRTYTVKTSDTKMVNLLMGCFEEIFGHENVFDLFIPQATDDPETLNININTAKTVLTTIKKRGQFPIYYVEKNVIFVIPRSYQHHEMFPTLLKNLYLNERVQSPSMPNVFVFA